jgi:hypothetical protein
VSGEFEVAADLATGALVARAVEAGGGAGAGSGSPACLNCGASLAGPFCGSCGQSATVHRTLHAFWHDFLHSILHFDGKVWRTLPLLLLKPGELTRRYIHGERAKFISPLALFLFSVFMMFAVFSWVGGPVTPATNTVQDGALITPQSIEKELRAKRAELAELQKQIVSGRPTPPKLEARIADVRQEIEGLRLGNGFAKGMSENRLQLPKATIDTGSKALDDRIRHAFDNPQLLLYKVQSNAYKFSWLLVPLSLPFVWLLFAFRREYHLYDHLIFITYSLCFMTLLAVVTALLGRAGPLNALQEPLILLAPPVHSFLHLRGAYALSTGGALWRTAALLIAALIVLLLFVGILLALGVF